MLRLFILCRSVKSVSHLIALGWKKCQLQSRLQNSADYAVRYNIARLLIVTINDSRTAYRYWELTLNLTLNRPHFLADDNLHESSRMRKEDADVVYIRFYHIALNIIIIIKWERQSRTEGKRRDVV